MSKYFQFCCSLLVVQLSWAQPNRSLTVGYTGLCAYSGHHADVFSFPVNQAALTAVKYFSVGISGERRFLLQELADYHAMIILPTPGGNFGMAAGYFGNQDYHEMSAGLAYAREMGRVRIGVQCGFWQSVARTYPVRTSVNVESGMILQVAENLRLGLHVFHPQELQKKFDGSGSLSVYSAALGYDVSEIFYLSISLHKTASLPIDADAGFHYSFGNQLFVRAGISFPDQAFFVGAGFHLNGLRIDIIMALHPSLGLTPGSMLSFMKKPAP